MKQLGVTFVEMMVVLLIVGLIAAAASPSTSAWVDGARVDEGIAALDEAVGRAKAAAMRNTAKIIGEQAPASKLCFSESKVSLVIPTSPGDSLTCDLTPVWSTTLSSSVSVKIADLDWVCSCFNNKGLIVKPVVCNTCSDLLKFKFQSGAQSEEHSYY